MITVFTPTFNRKHLLPRLYESLCKQTCNDFMWLIIDDGSTDGTEAYIKELIKKSPFNIEYYYKENGGLHTGYNMAIEKCHTELCMCCDSDDWLPDYCIQRINEIWASVKDLNYVGIMGLDSYENHKIVGDKFPDGLHEMYLYEKLNHYHISGDKKMVYRTELLKKVAPMPTFAEEKNFNPAYLMYKLDEYGKLFVTNEVLCIVEYQPDGMTKNMFKQYRNSPNSFIEIRKQYMSFPGNSIAFNFRQCIHYVSSSILAHKLFKGIAEAPNRAMTILALVPGCVLSIYIVAKSKE